MPAASPYLKKHLKIETASLYFIFDAQYATCYYESQQIVRFMRALTDMREAYDI